MSEVINEKEIVIDEKEIDEAQQVIQATEGPLKQMLVEYVGGVLEPEDGQVTVEMIVQAMASEFPEFLFVIAKENWMRGYEQALTDVENVEKERAQGVTTEKPESEGEDDSAFAG